MSSDRREFLRVAALPALAGFLPSWARAATTDETDAHEATLAAVARLALPSETLGEKALIDAIWRFSLWSDAFEPVAELDHAYLSTDELSYGPADPRPQWRAQLQALDLLAQKRHGRLFPELPAPEQRQLLESQLPSDLPTRLPHAGEAPHVAVAMMSWFYATTEANDLCHGAAIGRHTCRGLPSAVEEPESLAGVPDFTEQRQ